MFRLIYPQLFIQPLRGTLISGVKDFFEYQQVLPKEEALLRE